MRLIDADKLKAHYSWWKGGSRELTMDEAKSDFDAIIDQQPEIEAIAVDFIKHRIAICEAIPAPLCAEVLKTLLKGYSK